MQFDLVIRNARLRGRGEQPVSIGVAGERITAVAAEASTGSLTGVRTLDAGGGLVTESFANAHLHLCKVYTMSMVGDEVAGVYGAGDMGQALTAIDRAAAVKARYQEGWIYENARRAVLEGLRHGVTHVQAFVDTDTKARLEGIRALIRVRDELRGKVQVRVVAFPQDGLLRDPGAEAYIREAIALGADVVGGIPWLEETDAGSREHVDRMLKLAVEYDRDVAMLVDDAGDPSLRTAAMLAEGALRYGLEGRVIACHARAMALYPEPTVLRLAALARRAGLSFVSDPHTGSLYLRVERMLESGVNVALGQDDIEDAYYPFGQHNMLEVAFLAAHIMNWTTLRQMETLMEMITTNAARALRVDDHGVAEGCRADLVVLHGASVHEVLTRHEPPRWVISGGRVVAENRVESGLYLEG